MTAAQQSSDDWDFVSIIALPQTVTVETPRGSYTAAFENEARVYPDGRARGVLELSGPDGAPHRFRVLAGRVRVDDGTVTRAVLHLVEVDPRDHPRLEITVVIEPEPSMSEDCLIYTTIGTDAHLGSVWAHVCDPQVSVRHSRIWNGCPRPVQRILRVVVFSTSIHRVKQCRNNRVRPFEILVGRHQAHTGNQR